MRVDRERFLRFEPCVRLSDLKFFGSTSWTDIDARVSRLLNRDCLGIPSVRVGMCWALEYLGCNRHHDHVLLPKFIGRCILNSLNRHALPVEVPTPQTRVVVVVDQYGLRQDLDAISAECRRNGYTYFEDSPYGLGHVEERGRGSLARFIGLTKVLPVVQGAIMVSDDERLIEFVKRKREEQSGWSWTIWTVMALLRCSREVGGYSPIADAAYEMYLQGKGGNAWLRGNILRVLDGVDQIERVHAERLSLVGRHLAGRVLMPDLGRVAYVVPYVPGDRLEEAREAFRREGFDANRFHVDVNRNLFAPRHLKTLLIPVNSRIPTTAFEKLVHRLGKLSSGQHAPSAAEPLRLHETPALGDERKGRI